MLLEAPVFSGVRICLVLKRFRYGAERRGHPRLQRPLAHAGEPIDIRNETSHRVDFAS